MRRNGELEAGWRHLLTLSGATSPETALGHRHEFGSTDDRWDDD